MRENLSSKQSLSVTVRAEYIELGSESLSAEPGLFLTRSPAFHWTPDALFICSKMYYKCSFHVNEGIMKSLNSTTDEPRILLMKVLSWHI